MKLEEYESLPDSMSHDEIQRLCITALEESETEDIPVTLAKLDQLGHRQWHTYKLPDPALQSQLRQWLIDHWASPGQEYLEAVLSLSYCFGLDKEIFGQALMCYTGEHLEEFNKDLEKSDGNDIDPWWSMKQYSAGKTI